MTVIAACDIFDLGVHYFGLGEGQDECQFQVRCYTSSYGHLEYLMKRTIVGNVERSKLHMSKRSTAPHIVSTSLPPADRTILVIQSQQGGRAMALEVSM